MPARSLAPTSAPLGGAAVVCSLVTLTLCMLGGAQVSDADPATPRGLC